ncbi:MAG: peptide chain release factor N(5)-glutamine methyltransferase [Verrucomicrobia bacterium]|nr:peptide chain release factor N(5)-glutamine methyltransferase [Verrucomicrobiota bacterium]
MTIQEAIQKSAEFLEKRGVDSPRLQSELLLAHVLKLPRLKLYLQFDRALAEAEVNPLRELVKRRGAREPLQHLVGTAAFCGLELKVNRHVLVPRPETELLAERAAAFLATLNSRPPAVLDLGTGSGCLALQLAAQHPAARVVAVDVSPDALGVARENAAACKLAGRVEFLEGDLFAPLPPDARFDLIVSNPPYIPSAEIATLQPEVRDFDPRAALDGGADGLDFYRRLATGAATWLRAGGKLMVEFGDGQAAALGKIFTEHKWVVEAVVPDYSRRQRILVARAAN